MSVVKLIQAILVSICCASQAFAQESPVIFRSGEHSDFTRIVLSVPADSRWEIRQRSEMIDIVFEAPEIEFDLSQAFDRIPRTRLSEVVRIPNGVRLILACNCTFRTIDSTETQIIIDLLSPAETLVDVRGPAQRPKARPSIELAVDLPQRAGEALARTLKSSDTTIADPRYPLFQLAPRLEQNNAEQSSLDEAFVRQESDAVETLATIFAKAVSQNALSATQNSLDNGAASTYDMDQISFDHIKIPEKMPSHGALEVPDTCKFSVSAKIKNWAEQTKTDPVPANWSSLFTEVDKINEDAAINLFSILLRSGMGAEARSILLFLPESRSRSALESLSFIIDQEVPREKVLQEYSACSDHDSLWAFLEAPTATWVNEEALRSIVRASKSLNSTLQSLIIPEVIKSMVLIDYSEGVSMLRSLSPSRFNFENWMTTFSPVDADFLNLIGTMETNSVGLNHISDSDLFFMLEQSIIRGSVLPFPLLQLANDRRALQRDGEISERLSRLTAMAFANAGDFASAVHILRSTRFASESDQFDLAQELLATLLELESDSDFVTYAFALEPWGLPDLPAELSSRLGNRLAQLGFVDVAHDLEMRQRTAGADALDAGATRTTGHSATSGQPDFGRAESPEPPTGDDNQGLSASLGETQDYPEAAPEMPGLGGPFVLGALPVPSVEAVAETSAIPTSDNAVPSGPVVEQGLLNMGRMALSQSAELRSELIDLIGAGGLDRPEP